MNHKNKTKLLNSLGISIILIYFVTYISCDECSIKAICKCEPKNHSKFPTTNLHDNNFDADDKLNLCNITTVNNTYITGNNYVLNCVYIDKSNSSKFVPPNGTIPADSFALNLVYSCAGPPPPPVPSAYSTGTVLVIIFFTCVLSYLTLGICVNYILIGARGIEMLPHLDFWKDFPALVLDGVKFLQNGCIARPSDVSAPTGAEGYDAI